MSKAPLRHWHISPKQTENYICQDIENNQTANHLAKPPEITESGFHIGLTLFFYRSVRCDFYHETTVFQA